MDYRGPYLIKSFQNKVRFSVKSVSNRNFRKNIINQLVSDKNIISTKPLNTECRPWPCLSGTNQDLQNIAYNIYLQFIINQHLVISKENKGWLVLLHPPARIADIVT